MKNNKNGYTVKNNIIYVQGSINREFKRYSTGKKATKLNLSWIQKNAFDVLLKINEKKNNKITIKNMFVNFAIDVLNVTSLNREDSTNKEYLYVFNKYIKNAFENHHIKDIKKIDIQLWQNELTSKNISIGRIKFIRAVLSLIFTEAIQNEIIEKNPLSFVKIPKKDFNEQKTKKFGSPFSLDEISSIIDTLTGQNKNIVTTLFFTGMRTGELWGLKWSDIDFESKTIHIQRSIRHGKICPPKTKGSERIINMLPLVEEALHRQKSFTFLKNDFIFLNKNKKNFRDATKFSQGAWKRALEICNIKYRVLYQTRHTFATMMISRNEDVVWVSRMLGHSSTKITLDVYTKFIPKENKERAVFLNNFKVNNCIKTANTFKDIEKYA